MIIFAAMLIILARVMTACVGLVGAYEGIALMCDGIEEMINK